MSETGKTVSAGHLRGLDIARAFWEECGLPMMREQFPEVLPLVAVGLVGPGSERYGYDDEVSRDHDFEHGFCIYLPDEESVSRRTEFLLTRAYEKLPKEFCGLRRALLNPAGGNRYGVFRTAEVYRRMTGFEGTPVGWRPFLAISDEALCEATNGAVFYDGPGEFSAIREAWSNPPADVQRKKLCGYLIRMSQTGEYNTPRCLQRGDAAAAQLTAAEFVKASVRAFGWLHNRPAPYYKWLLRSLRDYPDAECIEQGLRAVLTGGTAGIGAASGSEAAEAIARVCTEMLRKVRETMPECVGAENLQQAAMALNDKVSDGVLRSMSPLAAVSGS